MVTKQKQVCLKALQEMCNVIYQVDKEDALEKSYNIQPEKSKILTEKKEKPHHPTRVGKWVSGAFGVLYAKL